MPLKQGARQETISENIAGPIRAGHKPDQTNGIAYSEASKGQDEAPRAAGVLFHVNGRVLLLKRAKSAEDYPGTWCTPGGGIEEGESTEQAATRECSEEIGFTPDNIKPLTVTNGYAVYMSGEEPNPTLNHEHDGFVWADVESLPDNLHPGVKEVVDMAIEQSKGEGMDSVAMDKTSREYDTNGWYEVKGNPLSKVGVFEYRGSQLPCAPDPNKMYKVYRSAEELQSQECIDSFKLLPWIDNHVMLGAEDEGLTPAERKGVHGVIGEEVYFDGDTLYGNIKVFSDSLSNAIKFGKKELSCGYRCQYVWNPGEYEGETYDCVQTNIRGNHLALVHNGRMGPDVAVLDSADSKLVFTFDWKEPSTMGEENVSAESPDEELRKALEMVQELMPAIKVLQKYAKAEQAEQAVVNSEEVPQEPAVKDEAPCEEEEKPEFVAKDEEPEEVEEEKKEVAMDAADIARDVIGKLARRDSLYKRVSVHTGAFAADSMDEAQVAEYAVKKLGIKAPKGAELAVLDGYLQAAKDPSKEKTVKTAAMDSAVKSDNFITRFLKGGK